MRSQRYLPIWEAVASNLGSFEYFSHCLFSLSKLSSWIRRKRQSRQYCISSPWLSFYTSLNF